MKKVIGMLAVVALVSSVASAELLKNFKYDGKIEVNAYDQSNSFDYNDKVKDTKSDIDTRVQVNMGFDLNEDVNAVVSAVKRDRQYGDNTTVDGQSVDNITAQVKFDQAYLNLKGVLGLDHKVGRQYYNGGTNLVIAYIPKGYPWTANLPVSAIDAWTGWYKTGKWDIHALSGKTANTTGGVVADLDTNLNGVAVNYQLMEDLKLGAYGYESKTMAAIGSLDTTLDVVGVKATGKFMGFDYYAELDKNYGKQAFQQKYTGMAFLGNVNYGMDLMGKLNLMGEYAMGSGDKKTTDKKNKAFHSINSIYRPGVIWGRSYAGLGNSDPGNTVTDTGLTLWNVGAKWTPASIEKLDLCAKYYYYAPTVTKKDGVKIGYTSVGNELDFSATWNHSENVMVRGTMARFTPNKKYTLVTEATTKHDAVKYVGADVTVKF